MPHITLLATPMTAGASLFGMQELFASANRILASTASQAANFSVTLTSVTGDAIHSMEGTAIAVAAAIGDTKPGDLLYIAPPSIGSPEDLRQQRRLWRETVEYLAGNHGKHRFIASHCCGSFLLAEAGLLHGGEATTAWWLTDTLASEFPAITVQPDAIVVQSGRCYTAAATSAYLDLGLELLRELSGPAISRLVAKYLMADRQRHSQAPYRLRPDTGADPLVNRACQWMKRHLAEDFRIEDLARELGTSSRTLIRHFQLSSGQSPLAILQHLRIDKSKMLLETTGLGLNEVVRRCGYRDESAFRRIFTQHCGLSPREFRLRFNIRS